MTESAEGRLNTGQGRKESSGPNVGRSSSAVQKDCALIAQAALKLGRADARLEADAYAAAGSAGGRGYIDPNAPDEQTFNVADDKTKSELRTARIQIDARIRTAMLALGEAMNIAVAHGPRKVEVVQDGTPRARKLVPRPWTPEAMQAEEERRARRRA